MRNRSVLALIPARGGSKSIPHKNLILLAGKPLIAWSIDPALKSAGVDRVIVSTEDAEIAEIAARFGAEIPFMRPASLARDDTPGIDPVLHAVNWLSENENYKPDYILLLQPTSPLRVVEDIDSALQLAQNSRADAVVSVCKVSQHPYWMKTIDAHGFIEDFIKLDAAVHSRQNLPAVYALNGAIYLVKRDVLLKEGTLFPEKTAAYIMPQERSIDIDEPLDIKLAEKLLQERIANAGD